ncbi:unnamed protein product [Prorocentrum cordatum]|uniref:Uncharacterized protein n=1 Tax=Prorocentrum cordatum TaxID=2364126 RepID=A0ABN9TN47_9DINO|nr:unnamed protein product [Polarella glacialis]
MHSSTSVAILALAVPGRALAMARESLRGVAAARFAADRLVPRLQRELQEAKEKLARAESELVHLKGPLADEVSQRVQLIVPVPVLKAKLGDGVVQPLVQRRRNVASHVFDVTAEEIATASPQRLNAMQRGGKSPQLEIEVEVCEAEPGVALPAVPWAHPSQAAVTRAPLRSSARPFILQPPGDWSRVGRQPSCEETAIAVLAGLGCGPLAQADIAAKPQVCGAAGAGTPPPLLEHLSGQTGESVEPEAAERAASWDLDAVPTSEASSGSSETSTADGGVADAGAPPPPRSGPGELGVVGGPASLRASACLGSDTSECSFGGKSEEDLSGENVFDAGERAADADAVTACTAAAPPAEGSSVVATYLLEHPAALLSGGGPDAGGGEDEAAPALGAASDDGAVLGFLSEVFLAAVAAAARGPCAAVDALLSLAEARAEVWLQQRERALGDRAVVEARAEGLLMQGGVPGALLEAAAAAKAAFLRGEATEGLRLLEAAQQSVDGSEVLAGAEPPVGVCLVEPAAGLLAGGEGGDARPKGAVGGPLRGMAARATDPPSREMRRELARRRFRSSSRPRSAGIARGE